MGPFCWHWGLGRCTGVLQKLWAKMPLVCLWFTPPPLLQGKWSIFRSWSWNCLLGNHSVLSHLTWNPRQQLSYHSDQGITPWAWLFYTEALGCILAAQEYLVREDGGNMKDNMYCGLSVSVVCSIVRPLGVWSRPLSWFSIRFEDSMGSWLPGPIETSTEETHMAT